MRIGIVTGASSGMGREFVKQIGKAYPVLDEIWVLARRASRLEELKKESKLPIRSIAVDLMEESGIDCLRYLLEKEKPSIKFLVNGAGFGKIGNFRQISYEDNSNMINLNCRALTEVTYCCLPFMERKSHIVQVASSAAFVPQPGFAVYAASKSYVLSFSRALNQELKARKISVTAVCPGPVDTEFFQVAEQEGKAAYFKKLVMVSPEQVVRKAIWDAVNNREKSVYGVIIKSVDVGAKVIPHKLLFPVMRKFFKQ